MKKKKQLYTTPLIKLIFRFHKKSKIFCIYYYLYTKPQKIIFKIKNYQLKIIANINNLFGYTYKDRGNNNNNKQLIILNLNLDDYNFI